MKNKFYVTTSIIYTNAPPHIGHVLEFVQADVIARYQRILGNDVFFLTGTDEHGSKIVKAAASKNKSPKEFVDEIASKFKSLKELLNLSTDDFIRTTDQERHWPSVEKVWLKLKENGDIYKQKYKGLYCVGCEAFITEKDLVDGKCLNHQKEPEMIEEENWFFKLSKYSDKVKEIIEKDEIHIIPETRKNENLSLARDGLKDVSFSRLRENLEWGIPAPNDKNQTIYVWTEALINYISALGYDKNSEKFKKYWPADIHCIGKDIQKFHCLIWPAMLLSLELPLPKKILVHGFITVDNQKMSKTLGNIVDPFELVNKYGTDPVRYFLLREVPPTEDGDFTYEKFEERYTADLAKGLGNLLARVVTLAKNKKPSSNDVVEAEVNKTKENCNKALEEFKFNEALVSIWESISWCDRYIEKEKPWEEKKGTETVVGNLLFALQNIAELLKPFLPETSEKILSQIKKGESKPLFPRLDKDM